MSLRSTAVVVALACASLASLASHAAAQRAPVSAPGGVLALDARIERRLADSARVLRAARHAHPDAAGPALRLADVLLAAGDRGGALALYDSLLVGAQPPAAAAAGAARLLLVARRPDSAATILERAVRRAPDDAELWPLLGQARMDQHRPADAVAAYARALPRAAVADSIERPLVGAELAAGDTSAALATLRGMTAPGRARGSLLWAAAAASDLADYALADVAYRTLVARDSGDVVGLARGAAAAVAAGDTARGVAYARRALSHVESGPEPALLLLRVARPDADSSRALLTLAAEAAVARHEALRGAALASVAARAAVESAPRDEALLRNILDTVVLRTAWGGEALAVLRREWPESALLRLYAGRLALESGRHAEALALFRVAVAHDPADADAQLGLAAALAATGENTAANGAASRALELAPERDDVFRLRVALAERTHTLDDALGQIRRLRERVPSSRALGEREVELLQRLGRLDEAARIARALPEEPHA